MGPSGFKKFSIYGFNKNRAKKKRKLNLFFPFWLFCLWFTKMKAHTSPELTPNVCLYRWSWTQIEKNTGDFLTMVRILSGKIQQYPRNFCIWMVHSVVWLIISSVADACVPLGRPFNLAASVLHSGSWMRPLEMLSWGLLALTKLWTLKRVRETNFCRKQMHERSLNQVTDHLPESWFLRHPRKKSF